MQERIKIDAKGRVLIPSGIRKGMGVDSGSEVLVSYDPDSKKAVITPLFDQDVVELVIMMSDEKGTLAKIAAFLSEAGFDIIMSESRSLERIKSAEWRVIGKYSGYPALLVKNLKNYSFVTDAKASKK